MEQHAYSKDLENQDSKGFIYYIKFEDELLAESDSTDIANFLGKPSFHEKNMFVESAFTRIGSKIREVEPQHVFLDIHLNYLYQSQFFPPVYRANFWELYPDEDEHVKVITLIDDAFVIWKNLKTREKYYPKTSLRLREILAWRSVELLQGEAVALEYTTETRQVKNYLVAVRHPFETFYNLIFNEEPIGLYLSFPITNTRISAECIEDINKFRIDMHDMASRIGAVVFDPVTIDELALQYGDSDGENCILREDKRWPLETECLATKPDWPIEIPEAEVNEAQSDIVNNIKPRDFKLIDNSISTIVYRKNYRGLSRGVNEEIRYTNSRGKRAYVYDPVEDSETGKPHPFDADEIGFRNLERFYDEIENAITHYRNQRAR